MKTPGARSGWYSAKDVEQIARIYIEQGKRKAPTIRAVRETFRATFLDATLTAWIRQNRHRFNDVVARLEQETAAAAEINVAVDPRRWVPRTIKSSEARLRFLQALWREHAEGDGKPPCDTCGRTAGEEAVKIALELSGKIQKEQESLIELHKLGEQVRNPKGSEIANVAVRGFIDALIASATDAEKELLSALLMRVKVCG